MNTGVIMDNLNNGDNQNNQHVNQNPIQPEVGQEKRKTNYWMILSIVLTVLVLILFGIFSLNLKTRGLKNEPSKVTLPSSPTPSISDQQETSKTSPPTVSGNVYKNKTFGISVTIPKDWFGPEVNEYGDGFGFEVGTDKVYPYGTDRLDRKYDKKNAYYISVQYTKKPPGTANDEYKKISLGSVATYPYLQ